MNSQTMVRVGAILGGLAVGTGAFGAHGLKDSVPQSQFEAWQTGAEYHMYHALALVLAGVLAGRGYRTRIAAWAFLLGTAIFAGTLYGIGVGGPKWLGAITPIGGTAMLVGWVALAFAKPGPADQPL